MAILRRSSFAFPRQWNPNQAPTFPVEFDPALTPSFAYMPCLGLPAPLLTRGACIETQNGLTFQPSPVGLGAAGIDGYFGGGGGAGNTYALPQTVGTILFLATVGWASNDSTSHYICQFGSPNYPGGPALDFTKYSDNNIYAGWYSGSDTRVQVAASGLWSAGATVALGLTWSTAGTTLYVNGKSVGTNATTPSVGNTAGQYINVGTYIGSGFTSSEWFNTTSSDSISYLQIFDFAMSAGQVAKFQAAPFSMLRPVVRRQFFAASSGSSFTATPGAGLIAFTGLAPTLAAAASASPGAGSILLTGAAPILAAGASLTPAAGLVAFSGFIPSVSTAANVSALPGAGLIALTGLAPTITAGANSTPGAGLIGIAGAAPTVTASASLAAGLGTITIAGLQPTFGSSANVSVSPGVGSVSFTGYAPTVAASYVGAPGPGSVVITGNVPTIPGQAWAFTPSPLRQCAAAPIIRFGSAQFDNRALSARQSNRSAGI